MDYSPRTELCDLLIISRIVAVSVFSARLCPRYQIQLRPRNPSGTSRIVLVGSKVPNCPDKRDSTVFGINIENFYSFLLVGLR